MKKNVWAGLAALFILCCGNSCGQSALSAPTTSSKVPSEEAASSKPSTVTAHVTVIGGGGAGLLAAANAAAENEQLQVMVLEQASHSGGVLREQKDNPWLKEVTEQVAAHKNITLLTDTKAVALLFDNEGAVRSVKAQGPQGDVTIETKSVIIAVGKDTDKNQNLLSVLEKNEKGLLLSGDKGALMRKANQTAAPKKCGVELSLPDNVPGLNLPASQGQLNGVFGAGAALESCDEELFAQNAAATGAAAAAFSNDA